jgi:hypothetical protein
MLPINTLNKQSKYTLEHSTSIGDVDAYSDMDDNISDEDDSAKTSDIVHNQDMQSKTHVKTQAPKYNYRALESLTKNVGEVNDVDYVVICPYSINTDGVAPFLQFGLINDGISLNFIKILWTEFSLDLETINNFHGHLLENKTLYLFFEYRPDNEDIFLFMFPVQSFVLADEIMNHRMVCRTAISIDVLDFFTRHNQFLYLENHRGKVYESPVVAYRGTYGENTKFMSTFGVACSQSDAVVGPYYYFTDYINAMKQGIVPTEEQLANDEFKQYLSADKKYRHGSVLRFALFLGTSKVVLNRPSDNIDESQMKQHLLSNEETSYMARLTMRISDYDGTWTNQYDSVYVGKVDLDDGCKYMNSPLWVVKDYNQQTFLSSHPIDRQKSLFL